MARGVVEYVQDEVKHIDPAAAGGVVVGAGAPPGAGAGAISAGGAGSIVDTGASSSTRCCNNTLRPLAQGHVA